MGLTMAQALHVAQAGIARADEKSVPSCIAVVDEGGNLLAFIGDERALLVCRELAVSKAFTSLSLRAPTSALSEASVPGGPFYGLNNALASRPLITFAGGQPLGDPVVGAVGVSGGTLEDDEDISLAAQAAFDGV